MNTVIYRTIRRPWRSPVIAACAAVLVCAGCSNTPISSNRPGIDVRFSGPDRGDRIVRHFKHDFNHATYFWFHEPEDQTTIMDVICPYVHPGQGEKVVNLDVYGRHEFPEAVARLITLGLVDIRNYTVTGYVVRPAGVRKKAAARKRGER